MLSGSEIIIIITKKGAFSAEEQFGPITEVPVDPLCSRLLLAKLHHGDCLLFTLIYLDCDNRGLTESRGYDVKEDLGIDF